VALFVFYCFASNYIFPHNSDKSVKRNQGHHAQTTKPAPKEKTNLAVPPQDPEKQDGRHYSSTQLLELWSGVFMGTIFVALLAYLWFVPNSSIEKLYAWLT
jgi:hypothetical protein